VITDLWGNIILLEKLNPQVRQMTPNATLVDRPIPYTALHLHYKPEPLKMAPSGIITCH